MNGSLKQSHESLSKLLAPEAVTEAQLAAYAAGYEIGLERYCEQNAYILGVKGQQYLGICDEMNIWFKDDYISGRKSTASFGL